MTVLSSREVLPTGLFKSPPKTRKKGAIEPMTPAKTLGPLSYPSGEATPSSSPSTQMGDFSRLACGNGLDPDWFSRWGTIRRRSLRLAAKSGLDETMANASASSGNGKSAGVENDRCSRNESTLGNTQRKSVGDVNNCVPNLGMEMVRVSDRNGRKNKDSERVEEMKSGADESVFIIVETEAMRSGGNSRLGSDLGSSGQSREKVTSAKSERRKRKLGVDASLSGLELVAEEGIERRFLNLRSGTKIAKRSVERTDGGSVGVESGDVDQLVHEVEADVGGKKGIALSGENRNGILMNVSKSDLGVGDDDAFRGRCRLRGEARGKGKLTSDVDTGKVELGLSEQMPSSAADSEAAHLRESVDIKRSNENLNTNESGTNVNTRMRLNREEKGKAKVKSDLLPNMADDLQLNLKSEFERSIENTASNPIRLAENGAPKEGVKVGESNIRVNDARRRDYKERFRDIARQNASRFAHFSSQEEEENRVAVETRREAPQREADGEMEDWPGPFSTAMKIIRDRELNGNVLQQNSSLDKSKSASVIWVPKRDCQRGQSIQVVPSLLDLCLDVLARNADAITSLDIVPDVLRHKLSKLLCDSRRMNSHILQLLISGTPTEIRVTDCSWLSEEHFVKSFEGHDTSKLTVLQLDQCGRCLPDYILFSTLAHVSKCLPALTTVSLKGACRLSDVGLRALVSSAPALRSINLGQCSLLTSDGINCLADSLGSILRELYIDDCQGIDAMLILPALAKLKHLEVLSIAGIHTVSDDFVSIFIAECGYNMKELILTDCVKLTDYAIKVIAENCSLLCAIDLSNLCKLTDSAVGYLANGCHAIQKLKLCRNAFSDEAVAAYLESCGKSLRELSLNNVRKVAHHTAISLARHSRNLLSLDLSWCRNLTNEALGLIVDSCLSLKVLKLFGCTQVANVFLDGHSNLQVQIIGMKLTPILEHLNVLDPLQRLLH